MSLVPFFAYANIQVLKFSKVLCVRIRVVLDRSDSSRNLFDVDVMLFVNQAFRHMTVLARLALRIVFVEFVLEFAVQPLQISCLFNVVVEIFEQLNRFTINKRLLIFVRFFVTERIVNDW